MNGSKHIMDFSEYPKTYTLTDGKEIQLRPLRADDRDRLFTFFRSLASKKRKYFKHDVTQMEVITNWCANLDYDRVLPILAVIRKGDHEQVIADGTLHTERHGWSTHVAEVRMVLLPKFRKKGLGRILLRELYDRAIARGVEKIQAMVRDDDAISLDSLKHLGFKKEALFKKHAIDATGRKHDVVVMYNDLDELWRAMDDLNIDYDFSVVP